MDDVRRWIETKATGSLNPSQVENALIELGKNWPATAPDLVDLIENFPLGAAALIHLFAVSSICATRLAQHPEILLWLNLPDVSTSARDRPEMASALYAIAGDEFFADNFRALRFWKNREMVRIALREIADAAPLEETTAELSQLAEICIRRVFQHWDAQLRQRHGSPQTGFAILAMGKLGGHELNHSSDVDLIFLYGEEGQISPRLSHHEFFNQLSSKILETFNSAHPEGSLFRVDLRLRPEGSAGPLARSLESMENYYSGFGETWERLALIKARGIGGSEELVYDFLRQHQPFIYPKSATPNLLEQIANIKQRIEHDVVGAEKLYRDVKLGRGGIREIEFVVQTLQFIHGARNAFLQETSTLKALGALAELELIPRNEVVDLDRVYRFLRRTEHRLQIEAEQQTHTVPKNPEHLQLLSGSLGFSSAEAFTTALEGEMQSVREIFERVVSAVPTAAKSTGLHVFTDQPRAERALTELEHGPTSTHVSARTRQLSRKLRPLLLEALAKGADPDATLNQFVRFVEAYGLRSLLFELLVTNPRLLELLIKTFDNSRFAGDLLVRDPQLLVDITRPGKLDRKIDIEGHLHELKSSAKNENVLESVRAYRQAQLLRILLRDVLGLVDLAGISIEQSALAEACLIFVSEILGNSDLTVIAVGKFGGRELSYGADLDVIFVGKDNAAAQKIVSTSAQASAEGNLSRIDARLRPDGEKGPLVCSVESYAQYYESRAQFWERQALTRARPVVGPRQDEFMKVAQRVWRRAGEDVDLWPKIDNMLERIRRERGSGTEFLDFKTGAGGMIAAEFLVQALQMRANIWEPNWTRAVDRLREEKQLTGPESEKLKRAYDFLRGCESILRRYENTSVSNLPADLRQQHAFCRRLGFDKIDIFAEQYRGARLSIHQVYCEHSGSDRSMSAKQLEDLLQDKKTNEQSGKHDQK